MVQGCTLGLQLQRTSTEAGAQESPRGGSDSLLLVHEGGADQTSAARQEKCLRRPVALCPVLSGGNTTRALRSTLGRPRHQLAQSTEEASQLCSEGPCCGIVVEVRTVYCSPVGPPPWEQGATTGQTEDATIPCLGLGGSARRSTGGRVLVVNRRRVWWRWHRCSMSFCPRLGCLWPLTQPRGLCCHFLGRHCAPPPLVSSQSTPGALLPPCPAPCPAAAGGAWYSVSHVLRQRLQLKPVTYRQKKTLNGSDAARART